MLYFGVACKQCLVQYDAKYPMKTISKIALGSTMILLSLPNDYTNYLSRIMASLSTANYPIIRPYLLQLYSKIYNADIIEADLQEPNFKDFFTRERSHPITVESNFVSPCDGQLFWKGTCQLHDDIGGMTLQDILKLPNSDEMWDYYILYLGPGDYHRFHAPQSCTFTSLLHYRGPLKPVAPWYFQYSLKPFSDNERVILYGKSDKNKLVYSAIGALHVGSMVVNNVNLNTNSSSKNHLYKIDPLIFSKGEEIGRFELGSCIVMAKSSERKEKRFEIVNTRVNVGQNI